MPGELPAVWGPVPGRNTAFTGRDGMLVQLREGLLAEGRTAVHALRGAGGVGKTQLAAEYAWRFAAEYDAVWWVGAEQADRIGEHYAVFAVALRLVDPATQVGPAVQALRRFCRSRGRWLVVLDNATSAADVRDWLLDGPGHVLVTSRDPHWREIATPVPVDVFVRDESVGLLRRDRPTLTLADASLLASALGDLPLAVAQCAGVLAETDMPAAEYLEQLAATPAEVLDAGTPVSYPESLAKAVRIAVERLTAADPATAELLRQCAFLAPEPIPTRWFAPGERWVFRRRLGLLSRYAWPNWPTTTLSCTA